MECDNFHPETVFSWSLLSAGGYKQEWAGRGSVSGRRLRQELALTGGQSKEDGRYKEEDAEPEGGD